MQERPPGELGTPQEPDVPASSRRVKVWDLPTRLFHWGLVLLVVVSVVTGFITPEWWLGVYLLNNSGHG